MEIVPRLWMPTPTAYQIKDLNAQRAKIPYKTVAEVDARIRCVRVSALFATPAHALR